MNILIRDSNWECVLTQDVNRVLVEFYTILYEIFTDCVPKFKFYSNYKKYDDTQKKIKTLLKRVN